MIQDTMLSQYGVMIAKIPSLGRWRFLLKRIVLFSWEKDSIVFEYEVLPESDDELWANGLCV